MLLRMTLAEGQEPVVTAPHVEAALQACDKANNTAKQWARLSIVPTRQPCGQIVHMEVGDIWDGKRQKHTQIYSFYQREDGSVGVHVQTIP